MTEPDFDRLEQAQGDLASFTSRKLDLIDAMLVDPRLLPSDFKVGVAMLQFLNSETGALFPSIETIAEIVRMSPRNVRKCLERLRGAGWIEWRRGNRQLANEYTFNLTNLNAMLDYRASINEARQDRKRQRRRYTSDRNHSSTQKILTGTTVPIASGTTVPIASGTTVPIASGTPVHPNTLMEHRKGTPEYQEGMDKEALDYQKFPHLLARVQIPQRQSTKKRRQKKSARHGLCSIAAMSRSTRRSPMAEVIAFPQERNVGKARHVAYLYLKRKTQRDRDSYWRSIINRLAGSMTRVGFSDAEIDRQLEAFRSAVEWEIGTIEAYDNQKPGPGAA